MRPSKYGWCIALCALVLASRGAHAQTSTESATESPSASAPSSAATESARAHFRLGVDFYRERNFRAALIEFQRAYADAPQYKLLYNLGQASLELQEYASAIDFLNAYLLEGGDQIAAERRTEVEQSIKYLESRIALLTVTTNREGAEIYVDDTLVGRAPLEKPARVGAGRHKLSAIVPGLSPVDRQIDVAAGDQREVHLDFVAPVESAPASTRPYETFEPVPESDGGGNAVPIILGVTTGVLAAGAIVMTIVTGAAQQTYQEELLVQTTHGKLDSLRSNAETKALITDVLWGATLVSAIATTIVIVIDETDDEQAGAGRLRIGIGPAALAVDGRF